MKYLRVLIFVVHTCISVTWAAILLADELPLAPGETVKITVYGRDDINGDRTIDSSGHVLIPLLGRVDANGATVAELEETVRAGLVAAALIENPSVFVDVVRRRDVVVGGEVRDAGAQVWRPGLNVEQAVAIAGGLRVIAVDQFGTVLQAYNAIERFQALDQSIGSLEAQEARLNAQRDFVNLVFDPTSVVSNPATTWLKVSAFLSAKNAALGASEREAAIVATLDDYDIATFLALQRSTSNLELIVFPDDVAARPELFDMRGTQQALIADWVGLNLAQMNSMQLQKLALVDNAKNLNEQRRLIDENLDQLKKQLDSILSLRSSGLARQTDVVALQTAYATMLSSRLELVTAIGDAAVALDRQGLSIDSFASTLRSDISRELTAIQSQLAESTVRKDQARRAAAIAEKYRGGDPAADAPSNVGYRIRRGNGDIVDALPDTALLPGDMVTVSLIEPL